MNKNFIFTATILAAALGSNIAIAAEVKTESPEQIFHELDKNNDNNITLKELRAHYQLQEDAMDKNHDQYVDRIEAKIQEHSVEFKDVDANHDGKVSFEEGFVVERKRFKIADTNHDGKVSRAEFDVEVKDVATKPASN